jgi:hypothetical protein
MRELSMASLSAWQNFTGLSEASVVRLESEFTPHFAPFHTFDRNLQNPSGVRVVVFPWIEG